MLNLCRHIHVERHQLQQPVKLLSLQVSMSFRCQGDLSRMMMTLIAARILMRVNFGSQAVFQSLVLGDARLNGRRCWHIVTAIVSGFSIDAQIPSWSPPLANPGCFLETIFLFSRSVTAGEPQIFASPP